MQSFSWHNLLNDDLQHATNRNTALTITQQIMFIVRVHFAVIGNKLGCHNCTVSRVVENVTDALIKHLHEFVVWPSPTEGSGKQCSGWFPQSTYIDGTHSRIQASHDDQASYMN
ncbi:hypothetical protein DPMN_087069 [Dreissena polymorpha]|uniref:Nuclease HARBI1 n=1 Tax=Dreissena polymorpha TaxID=45954 RepID=A0A9D4KRK3_DREPO|nr:hypothetical protein DPMN_087069 [Dreissena polymorpha]